MLATVAKNSEKREIKFFCSCPILLDFFIEIIYFSGKSEFKENLKVQTYALKQVTFLCSRGKYFQLQE